MPRAYNDSQRNFWRTVTNDGRYPCALQNLRKPCDGPIDAHHYLPKARINWQLDGKKGPRATMARGDVRNGICLCRLHHDMVHQAINPAICPAPPFYALFLADHGLHDDRPRYATPVDEVSA